MGARHKLNRASVNGALIAAAVVGLATESWFAFATVFLIAIVLSLHSGEIRLQGRRKK